MSQGENPITDTLNDALLKAEEILVKSKANLSPQLQKIVEDLGQLIGAAKQFSAKKNIGGRVNRIADETKMALEEVNLPGVSKKTVEATTETLKFVTTVRPIFQLLVSSREFRVLIVDSFEILKRIFLRHETEPKDTAKQQFLDGDTAMDIAITATNKNGRLFSRSRRQSECENFRRRVDKSPR